MTDDFYTHELWYRNAFDEDDLEWKPVEKRQLEISEDQTEIRVTGTSTFRGALKFDGQTVTIYFPEKFLFHDERQYQLRPIKPD